MQFHTVQPDHVYPEVTMKTPRFTLLSLPAALIALSLAGGISGIAQAEEAAQPAAAAPAEAAPPAVVPAASPAAEAPATPTATAQESTPEPAPPAEETAGKPAPGYDSSSPSHWNIDRFRERMEAQRKARQQALEQYRSSRRWWNNPYAEQRRLWNRARSQWYQKQAELRREYIEQHRPAYSYEYELPGYDYEYDYGPGYYYGRNDTTPGRWNGRPYYGGWGPWY
jgi:hypothetical protein